MMLFIRFFPRKCAAFLEDDVAEQDDAQAIWLPVIGKALAYLCLQDAQSKTKENTVFVVHGRDSKLRDSMYEFLGALGLKPQEWGHAIRAARGGNPYVNDAVTRIMERAQAIVVMLSPDDEVNLKSQFVTRNERATEGKLQGQARPNVIFETGIAIGTHHKKTVIVQMGEVKRFTDIGGMHILNLSGSDASRNEFANRLEKSGCKIDRARKELLPSAHLHPLWRARRLVSSRPGPASRPHALGRPDFSRIAFGQHTIRPHCVACPESGFRRAQKITNNGISPF